MLRNFQPRDIYNLREIWAKHYADQFDFRDFLLPQYIASYVCEDKDKIITAGGIRTIVEAVLVTDKDASPRQRVKALKEVLIPSCHFAERAGYSQIHAFVHEKQWENQLKSVGFRECKGTALYYNL